MATSIEEPSIKLADNGFIVCHRVREQEGEKTYDYSNSYKEEVFTEDQKDEALNRFIELGKASGKLKGSSKEEDKPKAKAETEAEY